MNKDDRDTLRRRLRAEHAKCLAKMSDHGRHAFEQRQQRPGERLGNGDDPKGEESILAKDIRNLVVEAQRLRQTAENNRDAFRGLDTELRALQLYGKATGEISNAHRTTRTRVDVIPTREEGVETATDLLLAVATADEIPTIMQRLEARLVELNSVPAMRADGNTSDSASAASTETRESMQIGPLPDCHEGDVDAGP